MAFVPLVAFALTLCDSHVNQFVPWFMGLALWAGVCIAWLLPEREALAVPVKPEELGNTIPELALTHQTEQHRRAGYVEKTHEKQQ